jgi:hypothetical protein
MKRADFLGNIVALDGGRLSDYRPCALGNDRQGRRPPMRLRKSGSGAFIIGAGSILDIGAVGPLTYPPARQRARTVNEALRSDLRRISRDLERGIERERESQRR